MAFQGIDIRQTGDRIVFRASLKDDAGAILASGTTNLRLYEVQSDGSLKSYDWNDNTFKTTALTTENQAMTHRTGNNSTTNTGIWTHALTTLSGFTAGNLYIAQIVNSGATPTEQEREFQFGVSSAFNPFDGVRGGLTALPNANADAAGGLIISDAGGLDADAMAANVLTAKSRVLHQPTCWYIDSDATGNNDGTSPTDAWQTLTDFSSASAAGMKPGDLLFINGTFTGESLFLDVDAITVRLKAYIDGTGDTTSTAGVRLEANFIDIEGGEIANFDGPSNDGYGVRLSDKRFCKIRKMRCHDNGFGGILARSARGTIVEDNFAYDNGVKGIVVSNNQSADPDPNNADVIVRRNFIHGNGRIGLQLGGTNGLENERGIEAYNNIIYNNGIGCRLESAYYVKFHHNWLENNDLTGVDPSGLATQTELEIQDGESCEIYENVFAGKTADSNFIDFTLYSTPAKYHKIFRNRVFNNSTGCNSLRIAINETDGIEITDNWLVSPNTGASDRHLVLAAALNGLVAGNVIVGAGEGIKFNGVSATAIEATDWTVTENTFDGQGVRAVRTGTLDADATYSGNRFVNQPVDGYVTATVGGTLTYYGVEGGSVNPITDKDATARTDAPNYRGPTTGSFIARDYTIRPVSTEQVTQQNNVTTILADTNELQSDWADGGRLDLILDAILEDTNELQADWVNGGRLDLLIDSILTKLGSFANLGSGTSAGANLADIFTMTSLARTAASSAATNLGTADDFGGGATIAENLRDIVGATFDGTTDSLEAIRNRGDAAWTTGSGSSSGSGEFAVNITVTDGTTPLPNVRVRLYANAVDDYYAVTNASGIAQFSLDANTYSVRINERGYTNFTPVDLVVSADTNATYALTAVSYVVSEDGSTTGLLIARDDNGDKAAGIVIYYQQVSLGLESTAYSNAVRTATSASDPLGLVQFPNLFAGAKYDFWRGYKGQKSRVTISDSPAATTDLTGIIGRP